MPQNQTFPSVIPKPQNCAPLIGDRTKRTIPTNSGRNFPFQCVKSQSLFVRVRVMFVNKTRNNAYGFLALSTYVTLNRLSIENRLYCAGYKNKQKTQ